MIAALRLGILLLVTASLAMADAFPYTGKLRTWAETEDLLVMHYHNWKSYRPQRLSDKEDPNVYFTSANEISYIELRERKSGKRLWRRPCTACSEVWISEDGAYVVGLSTIKKDNPYQLLVFNRSGKLLLRKRITGQKALFSSKELEAFLEEHPAAKPFLAGENLLPIDDNCYVTYDVRGLYRAIGKEAFRQLTDRLVKSPDSFEIHESVTNWVRWYNSIRGPGPKIIREDGATFLELNGVLRSKEVNGKRETVSDRFRIQIPSP